ncbi:MAG: hypothetical protein PHY47_11590 [Lachnospiraceae bacterium]|nr:hypothetical protein [Lachnospiraceae bacterium]
MNNKRKKIAKSVRKANNADLVKSQMIATLHFLITFLNDSVIFGSQSSTKIAQILSFYIFGKVLIFFLLSIAWYKIVKTNFSDDDTKKKIKIFSIYFVIMVLLLIAVWPGVWRWDELYTLGNLTEGQVHYWQHWLSALYEFLCLQLIPLPGGILIIQVVIISLVVTDIVWKLLINLKTKLVYLVYIPLMLPAILDSNLYPIRATPCAYLELWLVFQIIDMAFFDAICTTKTIAVLGMIGGIVTAWRPENIIYIVGLPIILVFTKKINANKVLLYLLLSSMIVFTSNQVNNNGLDGIIFSQNENGEITGQKEAYSLSGFITSLGDIVATDFNSNNKEADLELISDCMDLEMLTQSGGMATFWGGGLKEITPEKLAQLKKLYIKLVVYNFPEFMKSRWKVFVSTNFSNGNEIQLQASAHLYDEFTEEDTYEFINNYQDFRSRYAFNTPLSVELRKSVISFLECKKTTDYLGSSLPIVAWFYNVFPILISLLAIWIIETIKKNYTWFFVIGLLLAKCGIIFLTAPLSMFMYYFSTYLVGLMIIVFWFIKRGRFSV